MNIRAILFIWLVLANMALIAQDISGSEDHPAISRYPGSSIQWYQVENYMPYQIAAGPVTGYRQIDKRISVAGKVTRIYYELDGNPTLSEVYKNYRDALQKAQFDIFMDGLHPERNVKKAVGGFTWMNVAFIPNPVAGNTLFFSGSATVGGSAAVYGRKKGTGNIGSLYVLAHIRQYSDDKVVILVDIIEEAEAASGKITADAAYLQSEIDRYGKVAVYGILFDFDKATLQQASEPALTEVAKLLKANPQLSLYVVGHTDSKGTFAYNLRLSQQRAEAVVRALTEDFGIAASRLEAHGVASLVPVLTNRNDTGREKNRRVELVEQ